MSRRGGPDKDDLDANMIRAPTRHRVPETNPHSKSNLNEKNGGEPQRLTRESNPSVYELPIQERSDRPGNLTGSQLTEPTDDRLSVTSIDRTPRCYAHPPRHHASHATIGGGISTLTEEHDDPIVATVVRGTHQDNAATQKTGSIPFCKLLADWRILALLAVFVLMIIGLAVGLVFSIMSGKFSSLSLEGTNLNSGVPSISPSTFAPTWTNQDAMGVILARDFPVTPASQSAQEWVHDDPLLSSFSDDRILQRYALATLYFEVQESGLWESDIVIEEECQWYGIECNPEGKVTKIDLNSLELQGTFPIQLSLLTSMQSFVMWGNYFYGEIPEAFIAWENMEGFYIGGNDFTGPIPSFLYKMSSLKSLYVEWNMWDKGPVPSELKNLPNLLAFDFGATQRTGSIPEWVFDMPALGDISLGWNQLTGTLSTKIGRFRNLWNLRLGENFFDGTLPTELGLLTNLNWLDVNKNEFTGKIPTELGMCKIMTSLDLSTNRLRGPLPEEITFLTNMESWFGVAKNQLTGTIPTGLGRFRHLAGTFELDSNLFTGTIPSELGLLTNMTSAFNLYSNLLQGSLPTELGNLEMVPEIGIYHNVDLKGTIPVHFGNMTALQTLQLYGTALSGSMPKEVCLLSTEGALNSVVVDCDIECDCCSDCF